MTEAGHNLPQPSKSLGRRLKEFCRNLPLIKPLFEAEKDAHKEAAIEFCIVWIFSVVPIGFSILIDYVTNSSLKSGAIDSAEVSLRGIWARLLINLNGGEVFIYIISFLGTVAFVLYKYNRAGQRFEDFWAVVLFGGGMALIAVTIFALQRSQVIARYDLVNRGAAVMYFVTLYLFFVALLYEQRRTKSYASMLKSEESALSTEMSNYKPT